VPETALNVEVDMSVNGVKAFMRRFAKDDSGISAVEYGLLAAGIAVGIWAIMGDVGTSLGTIFETISADLEDAAAGAGGGGAG